MFSSEVLGGRRKIRVYFPHDAQNPTDSLALIIVHDGRDYVELANMPNVLDNLIAGRAIKSTIAVFIPPVDRNAEYAGRKVDQFTSFVISEVVAFARRRYRVSSKASDCATLGASNGGNIALWLGMTHPEIFGGVAAQSSNVTDTIAHDFRLGSKRDLRIYLDIGTFDIPTLIPRVKALGSVLENRGYDYILREVHEGHSWGSWRSRLSEILKFLFPASCGGTREYSFPSKRTP